MPVVDWEETFRERREKKTWKQGGKQIFFLINVGIEFVLYGTRDQFNEHKIRIKQVNMWQRPRSSVYRL